MLYCLHHRNEHFVHIGTDMDFTFPTQDALSKVLFMTLQNSFTHHLGLPYNTATDQEIHFTAKDLRQ